LNLYKAKNTKELLAGIDKTFTEESFDIFREELLALAEGKTGIAREAVTKTLTGERVDIIIQVTIAPGYEDTWAHVLVAITDITERTQTEEKFRLLATRALVGIYIIQDGFFKYVNPRLAEIFGYSEKELIDRMGPKQLTFKEDWPTASENLRRRMEGKEKSIHYTFRGITREGKSIDIEAFGSVMLYLGKPAVIGTLLDITDHKQAETALKHSNRALKTVSACNQVLIRAVDEIQFLDNICHAIVEQGDYKLAWIGHAEHDRARRVRPIAYAGFDAGYLESLNISWADTKKGRGPTGIAIRTRKPGMAQNIQADPGFSPWRQAALRHGYQSSIALPIMVDDEMFGALNVYASEPHAFIENEVNLLAELADDIGYGISMLRLQERRFQAEESLQKSERQYHEIINTARDAFICMDTDGNITDWNPQAEAIFGWRRAEILGQPVSETIIPPESRKKHEQGLKHYLATGEGSLIGRTIETFALHQDGHTFPVELSIVPTQINDSRRFNAFLRDISSRDKAQKSLKASLVGSILAISRAVEARDPYTAGHQQRVSQLARCIAQEMGLDGARIDGLRMGASIHDIGKIYLPAEILSKPTKLTEIEFELIKSHCKVGFDILKDIPSRWPIANIAYQHHERVDGTGYPQGLKGDEICLEARIVAVADVVEAISSHRPYRPALGMDVALKEIETHRGKWYDADVVDACLKLIHEGGFCFQSQSV